MSKSLDIVVVLLLRNNRKHRCGIVVSRGIVDYKNFMSSLNFLQYRHLNAYRMTF
jgi:hypothetical protein